MDYNNKAFAGSDDRAISELARLNRQALELLRTQAVAQPPAGQILPMFVELADLWRQLHPAAIVRAAACPWLLVDFAFLDARRWTAVSRDLVHDQERAPPRFAGPAADAVARAILTEVWHYARTRGTLLGIFGIPSTVAGIIANCTHTQILLAADTRLGWLEPRWPSRVWFWRNLLTCALAEDAEGLLRAGLEGLAMLAADVRQAAREYR